MLAARRRNIRRATQRSRRRARGVVPFWVVRRRRRGLGRRPAFAADPKVEKDAQALQKKAIEEDSLNVDYPRR